MFTDRPLSRPAISTPAAHLRFLTPDKQQDSADDEGSNAHLPEF